MQTFNKLFMATLLIGNSISMSSHADEQDTPPEHMVSINAMVNVGGKVVQLKTSPTAFNAAGFKCEFNVNKVDIKGVPYVRAEITCKQDDIVVTTNATCDDTTVNYTDVSYMDLRDASGEASVFVTCQTLNETIKQKKKA